MEKLKIKRSIKIATVLFSVGAVIFAFQFVSEKSNASGENTEQINVEKSEVETAIENALYTRKEFFGSQAIVPFPTSEARKRLAEVAEKDPDNTEVFRKLAELDEKLGRFDLAEKNLQKIIEIEKGKAFTLEYLFDFYQRRGEFEKAAEVLEKILAVSQKEYRSSIFYRLISFAQIHEIEKYLTPEFSQQITKQNPADFPLVESLINKLETEKSYGEALKILHLYKDKFLDKQDVLLEKETSLLLSMNQPKEAEKVYIEAFDSFWSKKMSEEFYSFLKGQDRFRPFGAELKNAFGRDKSNFETAVRLIHFRNRDSIYGNDSAANVILQVKKARSEKKISWTGEELVTASRLLLAEGDGDLASRFLYTLYLQSDLKPNSKLRGKILYQLFRLLIEADEERIALTKGDLKFYEDIGKSDPHPGITNGILSLIFSDTNPKSELAEKDRIATKYLNRAAAYRIFEAYKTEFPTSPELAQMYLEIVQLYIATDEKEIAEKTLAEFENRFEKTDDYPRVALTLAESFATAGQTKKEREIYQKILDYFGKENAVSPQKADVEHFTGQEKPNADVYENDYYENPTYNDFLTENKEEITYQKILDRLVSTYEGENRTKEILAIYSNEIAKYPQEEWLYERRVEQLENTNLFDEQLQVYKTALAKFKTTGWQDRLARWFLKHKREDEFAKFSEDVINNLSDTEMQNHLSQFIDGNINSNEFNRELYLKLYTTAHKRFPHSMSFVNGLLDYYKSQKQEENWRKLSAEYYFDSKEIRETFIKNLAEKGELRSYLTEAKEKCCADSGNSFDKLPYELFRADASAHLANFEEAVDAYRTLNKLYPNTPEFKERLISFTRSFGQKDSETLEESANIAKDQANSSPTNANYRTRSGEIQAELGDYKIAHDEWAKLIKTEKGSKDIYLETATVYWDYFQYEKALETIKLLRQKTNNEAIYSFQVGAILEAQDKLPEAVGEYIKAMDANFEEEFSDKDRAKRRLVTLSNRGENLALINSAFEKERGRQKDNSFLVLEYAEFLKDLEKAFQKRAKNLAADKRRFSQIEDKKFQISNIKFQKNLEVKTNSKSQKFDLCSSVSICGSKLLKQEVLRSNNKNFLDAARYFFQRFDDSENEIFTLKRLAKVAESPRDKISYYIELAENLKDNDQRIEAGKTLSELVAKFPTNYGVLSESADIFWQMEKRENAIRILETGVNRGIGKYKYIFSRKLAAKFVLMDRLESAENILLKLHDEDASDEKVFKELAGIFVRNGKVDELRKVFAETLDAIKKQDIEVREKNWQIAEFRKQMVEAFTRIKDYNSAIEQHIEIINREPDKDENTEAAIAFVKRYGGGEKLLAYYQKTADEAFKNYRWNLVLARIFEANNDAENAVKNYKLAIANQPEMPELYIAWANLETGRKSYVVALENIDKVLELTNEDTQYLMVKIKVLVKAGRHDEAEIVRQKLPVELRPKKTISDQFADAQSLKLSEKEKAIEEYRSAFNKLLENPFAHDLKSADVTGYVEILRPEEDLNVIAERLWNLREKFIAEAEGYNSTNAGKARKQLNTLDGALPEAIGNIAKRFATSNENLALQKDLGKRIDDVLGKTDNYSTLSLLRNIANRSGFGNLEETVLQRQLNAQTSEVNFHANLLSLIDFYEARGMYQKVLDVLESSRQIDKNATDFDYLRRIADTAKLVGNDEKELTALRENYKLATGKIRTEASDLVARYLEILYQNGENGKAELTELSKQISPHQIQLINFLLAKGEGVPAHLAIENSGLQSAWKLARNAETSLALREYGEENECYFCDALRFASIGEMIGQNPKKAEHLINNDWFNLARQYGEWLYIAPDEEMRKDADKFLPAMTENLPKNADEQAKIGKFYLEQRDAKNALEHLWIALEMNPTNKHIKANLGTIYFEIGDEQKARELWAEIIADEDLAYSDIELFWKTLAKQSLHSVAREILFPIIVKKLKEAGYENNYSDQKPEMPARLAELIRENSISFEDEKAKANYFQNLAGKVSENKVVLEFVIQERLVSKENLTRFYEMIIERSQALDDTDYSYQSISQKSFSRDEAEEIYDHEGNFKVEEPASERLNWQRKYLNFLIENRQFAKSKNLIESIENELAQKHARPEWLRIAKFKTQIADGEIKKSVIDAKHFIGIQTSENLREIKPPSVLRLNKVLEILRSEKLEAEARELLKAFYARNLATEQFTTSNISGLARIYFEEGEMGKGLYILKTLVAITSENGRQEALGDVASWEIVKAFAVDKIKTQSIDDASLNNALRLASEVASEFGQIKTAISYRRKLAELSPEDSENRLNLARLFAKNNDQSEAVKLLAEIINDRNAERSERWKAVWLAKEIVQHKSNLLGQISNAESEMRNAIEILVNNKISINVEDASSEFWFYVGSIAIEFNQNEFAFNSFQNVLIADKDFENPFSEESAFQKLTRLYIEKDQANAAFKLYEMDNGKKSDELLDLLSKEAERIGEFQKAVGFEKAKSREIDRERIEQLENLEREKSQKATDFAVDLENTRKL